jgi:hypothetical protein
MNGTDLPDCIVIGTLVKLQWIEKKRDGSVVGLRDWSLNCFMKGH